MSCVGELTDVAQDSRVDGDDDATDLETRRSVLEEFAPTGAENAPGSRLIFRNSAALQVRVGTLSDWEESEG